MGGYTLTISLRKDERDAIAKLMKEMGMKKHEAIKFALRRFLFPAEMTVPLNGRHLHMPGTLPHGVWGEGEVSSADIQKIVRKKEEKERKMLLKKLPEKDRKELEDLGVKFE